MSAWTRVGGALRGVLGDRLTAVDLAPTMTLVEEGRAVDRDARPAAAHAVVLVHGLAGSELDWGAGDVATGHVLERELGVTARLVRYNSGRAIDDSGLSLAGLLGRLGDAELTLIGHSLGGLVIRAACAVGALRGDAWVRRVRRAVYVGTPHRGAPLERAGQVAVEALGWVPLPAPQIIAAVASQRSAAVRGLGAHRQAHPLSKAFPHHFVAGTLHRAPVVSRLFGDGLVPVASATDGRPVDHADVAVVEACGHATLPRDPRVVAHLIRWCAAGR